MRLRSTPTSPVPSGCSRLDRKITYEFDAGSIHRLVPVKPVWPYDVPTGNRSPRLLENDVSMSQPRPRTLVMPGGVCGEVIAATVAADSTRVVPRRPLPSSMRANSLQIARGAEEAGVSGDAAHAPRRRIVHDAAQRRRVGTLARPRILIGAALGRRDARQQRLRRQEAGLRHAERPEHARLQVRIERLPGDARDDVAEQEEVDVAVDERLAGRRRRHFVFRQLDRGVVAGPRMQIDVGPQPRDVRQQVADRDAAFSVALESRDVARDRCR